MMLINDNYKKIKNLNECRETQMFWLFDLDEKDFFLKTVQTWYSLKSDAYVLSIGKYELEIPTNYYLLIGDYDAGLDCIPPDEIVGRDFQAFVFSNDFEQDSWELMDIKRKGYKHDREFELPFTKKPFPVMIDDNKAVLISSTDMYSKIKNLGFSDFI